MAMYGINYKGLHKRKNYEQLFDYLQNNQDMIRYPDRFAKQMRNHPYLTQFDSEEFGYMDTQQKEIKKQDAMTSTIQDQAAQPNAPSTTDLIARQPPRPQPTGVGQHLNIMGGPQAGRSLIPQSYGDTEVPLPVNQQPLMNRILVNGGPSDISSIRPYARRDDEVPIPITSRLSNPPPPSDRINRATPNRGDYMSIDAPTTGTLLDHANAILQTAGAVMHINGTPTADPRIANPFNSLGYLNADVVGVPRNLRSTLESDALPNILYDHRPYESSISDVDDFSDFSSVVNDFIHTVVERHLDQRSSFSGGSFQELPANLKPSASPFISFDSAPTNVEQQRMEQSDKESKELKRINKQKDRFLKDIRESELTLFDARQSIEKLDETINNETMKKSDKESSKFKEQIELNEKNKELSDMPLFETFSPITKITPENVKNYTIYILKNAVDLRKKLNNEVYNEALTKVSGRESKIKLASIIHYFDTIYKQHKGLYDKDFEKTYRVSKPSISTARSSKG